jgi:hypothetical protein
VIAALARWHDMHAEAERALAGVEALPTHAMLESYSALTRLPGGLALDADTAANLLTRRFPGAPLRLPDAEQSALLPTLASAGVFGGAGYDGLIALEAAAHGRTLLTLDRRAQASYRRLGVAFQFIAG